MGVCCCLRQPSPSCCSADQRHGTIIICTAPLGLLVLPAAPKHPASPLSPPPPTPPPPVQVIAEHFYREGRFSSGDTFCREAGISSSEQLKEPYTAMHKILQQVGLRLA